MRARARLAMAFAGGIIAALSLPPWGWWPLCIAGLALVAAAFTPADEQPVPPPRRRALLGLAFGLGMFLPGLWWVAEFHVVGYVVLTLLETSFFVAGALAVKSRYAFPGAVVLAEAARNAMPFGGLPLGGLALGQAGGPFVAASRLGGALLVLGVVAAIANAIAHRTRATAAIAAAASVVAALGWVVPDGRNRPGREPLDVAIVQGGGRRGFRAVDSDPAAVLDAHLRTSRNLGRPLDLVLWPENTIDVPALDGSAAEEALAAVARRTRATVVAGVTEDAGAGAANFENVAVVWLPDGTLGDRYTKVRRVPFGEYVPGRRIIERLADLSVLPRDAVAGHGPGVVRTSQGPMAVSISYEVFFAERARGGVRAGGGVLLVPTNAASFSTSQVPSQEVAAARLRAWETGRWVLQAAPTGYSAVVDWRGRVLARSVLGEPAILTADVPYRTGRTVYVRLGDAPVVLVALALVLAPLRRRARVRGSDA